MLEHHITKYWENGARFATSWFQLNIFGRCFCFNQKTISL